jgi:hypothetical protein
MLHAVFVTHGVGILSTCKIAAFITSHMIVLPTIRSGWKKTRDTNGFCVVEVILLFVGRPFFKMYIVQNGEEDLVLTST